MRNRSYKNQLRLKAVLVGPLLWAAVACSGPIESASLSPESKLGDDIFAPVSVSSIDSVATKKLMARNQEFERGLIKISENVYVANGYGASNFSMIVGDDGIVLVDAGQNPIASAEAYKDFREITDKPIVALIYTHGHGDHINGASAFVRNRDDIEIWAQEGFMAETRTFQQSGITANRLRGLRQAGIKLSRDQRINNGVAPAVYPSYKTSSKPPTIIAPNHFLKDTRQTIKIAGVSIEIVANPGETADQIYVWYADDGVLFAGDNFYKSWPNLYAIRGTPYRDVKEWASAIERMISVNATHLVGGHTRPISGQGNVRDALETYRDGVQYVFDKTIEGINKGLGPDQLVDYVQLPERLAGAEILTPYYGNPAWAVRSIFAGYLGWFDGNPTNLFPHSPAEEAKRVSSLAGGDENLFLNAVTAYENGDWQWAAQLCDYLIEVNYELNKVRQLKANALTQLAAQQITATARNYYLTVAQELREATSKK